MLVQFCFFGAYFITSYFSSDPINKIDYKNGMLLGLLISALGCFLFYPTAVPIVTAAPTSTKIPSIPSFN